MDESREHILNEDGPVESLVDDKNDAGFDQFSSTLDSLVARLDGETGQSSSSLISAQDMEIFEVEHRAELEEFLAPPTDFKPLIAEPDEAAPNLQDTRFPMPYPVDSATDFGDQFGEADPLQLDSTSFPSNIAFESEASPAFDELPMFVEQHDENEGRATEQGFVSSESLNETGGVLGSLIADIDNQLALSEGAAGTQVVSPAFGTNSNEAVTEVEEQHVIFTLDGASYSLPIASVTEIGRPLAVTPLPNVPEWMAGVANLRGDIISVVDLRRFFGLGADEAPRGGRMLVVRSKSEEIQTALMVDAVSGIRIFNGGQVQQVTAPVETCVSPYMRGVYEHDKGLVVLLDPEKLMLSPEMQQFEAAAADLNRGRASQSFDTQANLTTTS